MHFFLRSCILWTCPAHFIFRTNLIIPYIVSIYGSIYLSYLWIKFIYYISSFSDKVQASLPYSEIGQFIILWSDILPSVCWSGLHNTDNSKIFIIYLYLYRLIRPTILRYEARI